MLNLAAAAAAAYSSIAGLQVPILKGRPQRQRQRLAGPFFSSPSSSWPRSRIERIVPEKRRDSLFDALLVDGHLPAAVEVQRPHDMRTEDVVDNRAWA